MPSKQQSAQKSRSHKESGHNRRSSQKVPLIELQKVLIANGGVGHGRLRGRVKLGSR